MKRRLVLNVYIPAGRSLLAGFITPGKLKNVLNVRPFMKTQIFAEMRKGHKQKSSKTICFDLHTGGPVCYMRR